MWDLPGPGVKPVSPALAGGFLTTDHPHPQPRPCLIRINLALIPIHKDTDVWNWFIILPDSFLPHFHYFIVSRCSSGPYKLLNNTHKALSRSIIFVLFCFVLFVLVLWRATETYFNLVLTRSPHPSLLWISVTMLFFAFVQQIDYVWQTPASVLFSILKMLHWPLTFILMTSWVQIPSSFSFPRSPVFGNYLPCDIYSWRTSAQGRRCFHLYDLPPGPVE